MLAAAGSALDQLSAYLCNYLRALKLETTAFAHEPLYFFLYFDLLYFLKRISFNLIGHDQEIEMTTVFQPSRL